MKEIPLTQGKVALVDDEDYDTLMQWKWYAHKGRYTFYAGRNVLRGAGGQRTVKMHRFLLSLEGKEVQVDHIDRNGLNNQRSNLRLVTYSQNNRNQKPRIDGTSQYKGVRKKGRKWYARVQCDGVRCFIGSFNSEVEAALAYDQAAIRLFGEYAYINFPNGVQSGI